MKKLIVSLAVVLVAGVIPVLANATDSDPRAEKKFAEEFAGAQNVKWTRLSDGFLRVSFVLNGVGAESFFDRDAELVGTMRNMFYSQLPLPVMQAIDKKFGQITVVEVREITNDDGTSYKVVFEKSGMKYDIRLSSLGIVDVKKEKLNK